MAQDQEDLEMRARKEKELDRHYAWKFHRRIADHAGWLYMSVDPQAALEQASIPELLVLGDLARRDKEFENAYAFYSRAFIRADMPRGADFAHEKYKDGAVRRLERFVDQATKHLEARRVSPDRKRWIGMYIMSAEQITKRYKR